MLELGYSKRGAILLKSTWKIVDQMLIVLSWGMYGSLQWEFERFLFYWSYFSI